MIGAASAMSGAATSVSRTCWTMWIENRAVSYRSMPDSSAMASATMPAAKAADRRRGTGFAGCAASTRRTASHQASEATAMAIVGSGSNVQPRRIDAASGGVAGAGP